MSDPSPAPTPPASIAGLRREYMHEPLDEASAAHDPWHQFERWFEEVRKSETLDPNAMTLATVSAMGTPSARTVLLKDFDENGFVFYTNFDSRKGRELAANAAACLLFFWHELARQVRIEGRVGKVSPEEADAYFRSRPLGARRSAWASPQSETVAGRKTLEDEVERVAERYGDDPPRPPHWGGFRLVPTAVEFWQGRPNRLHDRLLYTRAADGGWRIERLAP